MRYVAAKMPPSVTTELTAKANHHQRGAGFSTMPQMMSVTAACDSARTGDDAPDCAGGRTTDEAFAFAVASCVARPSFMLILAAIPLEHGCEARRSLFPPH